MDYRKQIISVINKYCKEGALSEKEMNRNLIDFGIDSLILIRIIVEIEELVEIEIPTEKLVYANLNTVEKLLACVEKLINK